MLLIDFLSRLAEKNVGMDPYRIQVKYNMRAEENEAYFDTDVMTCDNWAEPMTETLAFCLTVLNISGARGWK